MFDAIPDIREIHDEFGVRVTPNSGDAFVGIVSATDRTAFDAVTAGDYTLRYLAVDVVLADGDEIFVGEAPYQVVTTPQRINAQEFVVGLMAGHADDEGDG